MIIEGHRSLLPSLLKLIGFQTCVNLNDLSFGFLTAGLHSTDHVVGDETATCSRSWNSIIESMQLHDCCESDATAAAGCCS
jgi:hypothetical protein